MTRFTKIKSIAVAIGIAVASAAAPADAAAYACGSTSPYLAHYAFNQTYAVSAIAKLTETPCGGSTSNSDTAPIGLSEVVDVFAKTDPITRALLLGVTTDLPGDPPGQQHLVVFGNDLFAARAISISFGTLFPTSNEDSLVAALLSLAAGTGSDSDYGLLAAFSDGDARSGPNGDAGFVFGGSFTAIAFSDGLIIGQGSSFASEASASTVPEPVTWVMLIMGFGMAGIALRRRPQMLHPIFA